VELGHALGLSVVAEGVENQDTYDALVGMGCDRLQGYHIAQPMSPAALKAWLDTAALHGGPVPAVPTAPIAAPVTTTPGASIPVQGSSSSLPSPAA
jgi:predicted signal transduction protein with EAL and GGDEF domain